jgi:hypothetical protein
MHPRLKSLQADGATTYQDLQWHDTNGVWTPQGAPIQYAEVGGNNSTTSSTYQQRLKLTTASLPAGLYQISWWHTMAASGTSGDVGVRVQLDDTTDVIEYELEMINISTLHNPPMGGSMRLDLSSGVHTFDYDWRAISGGITAFLGIARILVRWVGR